MKEPLAKNDNSKGDFIPLFPSDFNLYKLSIIISHVMNSIDLILNKTVFEYFSL